MATFAIPPEEQTQLRALARATKDKKTADRIRIILALADGHSAKHVAELFLIDEDTVSEWRKKYQKRRLFSDWLSMATTGYTGKLSDDQLRELEAHVEAQTITDVLTIVEFIQAQYGETYTVNGATKLLHRLGFVYKQTTLVPGKLNEESQAAFMSESATVSILAIMFTLPKLGLKRAGTSKSRPVLVGGDSTLMVSWNLRP
jgi:transposase